MKNDTGRRGRRKQPSPGAWISLAPIYHYIFPARKAQLDFISSVFGRTARPVRRVLDVGCGSGAYALALADRGFAMTGIDLDREMIAQARLAAERRAAAKAGESSTALHAARAPAPRFLTADMNDLELLREAAPEGPGEPPDAASGATSGRPPFDGVICLGNTLAHMLSAAELGTALGQMASVLAPDGKAVLQTVNYDRLELCGETRLPTITVRVPQAVARTLGVAPENAEPGGKPVCARGRRCRESGPGNERKTPPEGGPELELEFRRLYLPRADGLVTFVTSLNEIGSSRPLCRAATLLRPVVKEELVTVARMTFHGEVQTYGDFLFSDWSEASPATVVVATRVEE